MRKGWYETTLGQIAEVQSGSGFPKKFQGENEGDYPFVKVGDMNLLENQREIVTANNWVMENVRDELRAKIYAPGSIIFPKIGAAIATNKKRLVKLPCCADNNVIGLIPDTDKVLPEFLYYWMLQHDLTEFANDSNPPSMRKSTIEDFGLVITDNLNEQKRIVAILDEAFAGIDTAITNTEKNLTNARELFESYLQKIFNQHGEGWEVKPLESFSNIVNGYAFKSGDFSPQNEVKSIKITNVGVYEFVQESDNYLPKNFLEEYSRYKAYEGDVVVALTRTIISSGLKVAVVPAEYDGALINQRVAAVQVDEDVMPKQILQAFLSTKIAIDYVRSNVNELMQPNLSIKDLKAFPIPVPPVDQVSSVSNQIAEIREKKNQLVALYASKIDSLNELKQSLLQKAFSGELTAEGDKLMDEAMA